VADPLSPAGDQRRRADQAPTLDGRCCHPLSYIRTVFSVIQ
jgi:hypothetical protein